MIDSAPDGQTSSASSRAGRDLVCGLLALVLGLVIGWVDLHVTEVAVTILALIAAGLLLGLIQPAAAWRWAVLVVLGLPIMEAVALAARLRTAEPVRLDIRITLVAVAFGLAGTYLGVFIRRAASAPDGR